MRSSTSLVLTASIALASAIASAAPTYQIKNFKSSGIQDGDRAFISTEFVGSSAKFDTNSIGHFQDGTLRIGGAHGGTYGWNSAIPRDVDTSGNDYALNPDRGDKTTAFGGEAGKTAKLSEVFGQSNLGYLLDGEAERAWTLDLMYGNGGYITADGSSDPELLMLERGANSKLGVRAILEGGAFSQDFIMDFHTNKQAGLTDYTLNTLEIDGAQQVGGIGVSLDAFGLAKGTKILGYQYFSDDSGYFEGPDFIGFVASRTTPTPVPEPMSIFAMSAGLAFFAKKRKNRA